jgi:hypothetical protein
MNETKIEIQTSLKELLNKIEANLGKEVHVCKICGIKMSPEACMFHQEKTGHNEFKPDFNDKQRRTYLN